MIDVETLMNDKKLLLEENQMLRELAQEVLIENSLLKHQLDLAENHILHSPGSCSDEEEG